MNIDDQVVHGVIKTLHSADSFLIPLSRGDGLPIGEFTKFINNLEENRCLFSQIPSEIREMVSTVVDIPLFMQNSVNIVDVSDREMFEEAIVRIQDLLRSLFSNRPETNDAATNQTT